ncbi:hypothetical protein [Flavobacterium sp. H122]|uniref:hypothetical protein n=1 Tax=Flavobacterium sp. H122 TaxID=2529860 RepID=UPI0010AAFD3A|nr:hypothetical protein [Flavobacterium sp. H122]
MNNTVSVKEAITKGKIYLMLVPCLIIFELPILVGFLAFFYEFSPWIILISIVFGIILGCLFWSYNVVKWKIWAYENVRNVHELKRKAIRYNLIHSDNSWLNKTEIINDHQRQRLEQLEKKFQIEDIYHDDPSIPSEIRVSYSKWKALANFIVFGVVVLLGFALKYEGKIAFGWVIIIVGAYFMYKNARKLFLMTALFKMNDNGITTPEFGCLTWDLVPYCYVEQRGLGKHSEEYFTFFAKGKGSHEILLDKTNISMEKLEDCIRVYRIRFQNKNIS